MGGNEYIGDRQRHLHPERRHQSYPVLFLGNDTGGSGTYTLSGTGILTAGGEYIGYSGSGAFTQSGGTNTVTLGNLSLGMAPAPAAPIT